MEKKNINEITRIMREIRKQKKKVYTNYYYSYNASDALFDVMEFDETVIFCVQELEIYRVFYYSANEGELLNCLKQIPKGAVLDIIAKEGEFDSNWLEGTGFELYSIYGRYGRKLLGYEEEKERASHNRLNDYYNEQYGEYAKMDDVEEIQNIINNVFDKKTDHLFSDDEMRELIQKQWVIVQRENNEIYCIYIFKIEGKKFYCNLTYNQGTADVLYSIERRALLEAIRDYGVNYGYSWISLANKKAQKRNSWEADHVQNYIFQKN